MTDTTANDPNRGKGGLFAPGNNANPSGRPKVPNVVKDLLREATPKAMRVLVELLDSDNPKLRLQSATEILNRSLGKPVQALDVKTDVNVASAQLAALTALATAAVRPPDDTRTIDVTPRRADRPALPPVAPSLADLAALAPDSRKEER
jgi:hypothetical protein